MAIRVAHIPFPESNHVNAWIVWCPTAGTGVVVDPGGWDERIPDLIREQDITVEGIVLTHSHWDHTGGLDEALRILGGPLMATAEALHQVRDLLGSEPSRSLADGDEVAIGGHPARVYEVPGHIDDQIVLHVEGHLIAGDTLFAAALGGTPDEEAFHLQAGRLRRLLHHLPGETVVHAGHGPLTQITLERLYNPFLKGVEPRWKGAMGGW